MNEEMIEKVARAISEAAYDNMRVQGFSGGWDHEELGRAIAEAAMSAYNPNERLRDALIEARSALALALSEHGLARDMVPDEEEGLAAQVFCHHINHADGPMIEAMSKIDSALSPLPQGED